MSLLRRDPADQPAAREEAERRAAAEHAALRARLLRTVARTEAYAADLLAEVQQWTHAREDPT